MSNCFERIIQPVKVIGSKQGDERMVTYIRLSESKSTVATELEQTVVGLGIELVFQIAGGTMVDTDGVLLGASKVYGNWSR